jgi:DNA modification methylase
MKPRFTGDLALNADPFQVVLNDSIHARLILTDPPYNLGFDYGEVSDSRTGDGYELEIADFLAKSYEAADDDAHLMVIHYHEHFLDLAATYKAAPWKRHQIATWTYSGHTPCPTTNRLRRATRAIYWATKGNPPFYLDSIRRAYRNPTDRRIRAQVKAGKTGAKATDHFHVEQVKMGSKEHLGYSNQIPQALLRQLIQATTQPGEVVCDPFAGTGSTLRAALDLGRRAWGCDANPQAPCFTVPMAPRQELLA